MARQHGDASGVADALPEQAEHERVELQVRQQLHRASILGPHELALVEPAHGEPNADAVVREHLHAVGSAVGEQVRMVRPGHAEDVDDTNECRFGACLQFQRLDGHPHSIHSDHRNSSRIQAPKGSFDHNSQTQPELPTDCPRLSHS